MTSTASPSARPKTAPTFALWRDRNGVFSWIRAVSLAAALLPAIWLAGRIAAADLGPRPVTAAIHFSGLWTIRFLAVTLAITPVIAAFRFPKLVAARRILGVTVFAYVFVHFCLFIADKSFDPVVVVQEIVKRIYLVIGFVALVGLGALAATSTDSAVRKLGAERWRRLHQTVYLIVVLGLVHFFMQSKADVTEPTIMAALIGFLLLLRLPKRFGWALSPLAVAVCAIVASAAAFVLEAFWFMWKIGADFGDIVDADLDVSMGLRPCWWPLIAGLAFALCIAVWRWRKDRASPAPLRLKNALT